MAFQIEKKQTNADKIRQMKDYEGRLAAYEAAEAEGRLIVLPCKVGDVVYYIPSYAKKVFRGTCNSISIHGAGIQINIYDVDGDNVSHPPKRVFPTKAEAPPSVIEASRKNELTVNAAYQVTKMEPEEQAEIAQRIEQGDTPKEVVSEVRNRPHVANNSGNNEWYTPADYIEAAREVMGSIDIDPASNDIAQKTVKAAVYYTAETNGLDKEWRGNVWMNPPYASDLIGKFIDKLDGIDDNGDIIYKFNEAVTFEQCRNEEKVDFVKV